MQSRLFLTIKYNQLTIVIVLLASLVCSLLHITINPNLASAASGDVVINELMYHPSSDNEDDEFLELYNTTGSPIDLNGWCFTDGISLCFSSGMSIGANDFVLVSPSASQTTTTYSQTVLAEYSGNLSNGGENIELRDSSNTLVDSVDYLDVSPWPVTPDELGPSLELKDSSLDNSLSTSWGASLSDGGTPNTENSLSSADLPELSSLSTPKNTSSLEAIQPTDTPTITVQASNVDTVNLVYKVMFEDEETIAMNDSGNNGDQTASDGIYSGQIPTQTAGSLVRYRVEATSPGSDTAGLPGNDDSINYQGYVVVDPSQEVGSTPILEWFISESDYTDLIATPDDQEDYFSCVIVYGNQVIDNSEVRIKGEYSRTFPKLPFKIKLPKNHKLAIPGVLEYPLNEFHLNTDFPNNEYIVSLLSWRIFKHAGFPVPQVKKIQLQKNGEFEGAYTLAEKYEKEWLDRNPAYKDAEIIEDEFEKKQPDNNDTTRLQNLKSALSSLSGGAKLDYLRDNIEITNIINYMAAQSVARSHDWSLASNTFSIYNAGDRERWSFLPWDLDLTMSVHNIGLGVPPQGYDDLINPYDVVPSISVDDRNVFTAIWDDPELQEMYKRRVRTLVDEIYANNTIQEWLDDEAATSLTASDLDYQKWYTYEYDTNIQPVRDYITDVVGQDPDNPLVMQSILDQKTGGGLRLEDLPFQHATYEPYTPANRFSILRFSLDKLRDRFLTNYVSRGLIPAAQLNNVIIDIEDISYTASQNANYNYIKLSNPNNIAVDISNWTIDGTNFTFPGGSVLPKNGTGYVVSDDAMFRQEIGSGKLVLAEYIGQVAGDSEYGLRRSDGSKVYTNTTINEVDSSSGPEISTEKARDNGSFANDNTVIDQAKEKDEDISKKIPGNNEQTNLNANQIQNTEKSQTTNILFIGITMIVTSSMLMLLYKLANRGTTK